jgi:hypothetical protein
MKKSQAFPDTNLDNLHWQGGCDPLPLLWRLALALTPPAHPPYCHDCLKGFSADRFEGVGNEGKGDVAVGGRVGGGEDGRCLKRE